MGNKGGEGAGWRGGQIHTERRPNKDSVYSPHTEITHANKNQFEPLRATSRQSRPTCAGGKKKRNKNF